MASIYLVRHAIAEDRDAERWPDDALRPLTKDGEKKFRRAARGLREVASTVDVVLASPYVRAWRTAEILHEEAKWPPPAREERLEAWRDPSDGLALTGGDGTIALVGHEPYLSRLASLVLTGDDDKVHIDFKKGGVILLEGTMLRWYATPKMLVAIP